MRRRGAVIIAAGLAVAVLATLLALPWLRPAMFFGVSGDDLSDSVGRQVHGSSAVMPPCRRSVGHHWSCEVADADSGSARYEVTMRRRGCWSAERRSKPGDYLGPMPRRVSGCIRLQDYIHILD